MPIRPIEDSDVDMADVGAPAAKRARHSGADGLQEFVDLGLPMDKALAQSYTFFSPTPSTDDDNGFVLGVDEAGRGPVLGPMVYAACFCRESYYDALSSVGFADSKQLSEAQRAELFRKLQEPKTQEHSGWAIRCISPQDISQCMLRRSKYSLNALAHDATIQLLRDVLDRGIRVRRVYIDTVGPPETYQRKLQGLFPDIDEIRVAKKADSIYPIVSAASICAKVTRDAHLANWVFAEPLPRPLSTKYGSGYPGDPNTIKWLRESLDPVFGFPGIIRFSWSTCSKLLEERGARVVWPGDDEGEGAAKGRKKAPASAYFARGGMAADSRPRSKFFSRHKAIELGTASL
ncbi:hypothetical protein GGF46_002653 [Coemansia sp. RSA 552]|nr:hypothetical protein GGF46_002653 [Coemansia sp. RSA 552]